MAFLDCFRPSESGQAHINVKIGCCNKKYKRKLSKVDSAKMISLLELSDDKFNKIMEHLDRLNNNIPHNIGTI